MKYMCLVYFKDGAFEGMSEAELTQFADACIEEDIELERRGHLIHAGPLQGRESAVTVSRRNGKASCTDGPFGETKELIAGYVLLEARDMDEAIALSLESEVTKRGYIEIWPILEQTHSQTGAHRPG